MHLILNLRSFLPWVGQTKIIHNLFNVGFQITESKKSSSFLLMFNKEAEKWGTNIKEYIPHICYKRDGLSANTHNLFNTPKARVRHATNLSNFVVQVCCTTKLPVWLGKLPKFCRVAQLIFCTETIFILLSLSWDPPACPLIYLAVSTIHLMHPIERWSD